MYGSASPVSTAGKFDRTLLGGPQVSRAAHAARWWSLMRPPRAPGRTNGRSATSAGSGARWTARSWPPLRRGPCAGRQQDGKEGCAGTLLFAMSVKTGYRTVSDMLVTLMSVNICCRWVVRACSSNARYSLIRIRHSCPMLAAKPARSAAQQPMPSMFAGSRGGRAMGVQSAVRRGQLPHER